MNKRKAKKGAGKKWAAKLKELGAQVPAKSMVDKLNEKEQHKKLWHLVKILVFTVA